MRRIFARTFNLKLRREPRRVGDQVLRVKVLDFDRLSSDDPLGTLEIDVFEVTSQRFSLVPVFVTPVFVWTGVSD